MKRKPQGEKLRLVRSSNLKTRRKLLVFILLSAFSFQLSVFLCGCEAFRKKFVRKPKKEKEIRVVTQTQDYEALYSPEVGYKQYYLFWRTSHEELVNLLGTQRKNRKKLIYSAKKTVEQLRQMYDLLLPEKQKELQPFILKQESIVRSLDKRRLTRAQELEARNILKRQKKQIEQRFTLKDVQEYLNRQ